jgi:hypothetical protein
MIETTSPELSPAVRLELHHERLDDMLHHVELERALAEERPIGGTTAVRTALAAEVAALVRGRG